MSSENRISGSDLIDAVDKSVSAVRTRSLDISFNELVDMYKSQELLIEPEFQRLFRWKEESRSRLIESLILELPLPPIYLLEMEEGAYELIDGLQRISSYLHFRGELILEDGTKEEPLELTGCDIVPELNGLTYAELPRSVEIKLKRNFIRAEILRKESDNRLRYYMFKRLNTGGEVLEAQEIRNCTIRLLSNQFNSMLVNLSTNGDFVYCIGSVANAKVKKKYDQELVLRFFAYKNNGERYKHSIADFLTEYMEEQSDPEKSEFDYPGERSIFLQTFRVLRAAAEREPELGENIFGSVDPRSGNVKGQFSSYHFEAIALGVGLSLDLLNHDQEEQMEGLGSLLLKLKKSEDLRKLIGGGKNDARPFRDRIQLFYDAVREFAAS